MQLIIKASLYADMMRLRQCNRSDIAFAMNISFTTKHVGESSADYFNFANIIALSVRYSANVAGGELDNYQASILQTLVAYLNFRIVGVYADAGLYLS